MVSVSCFGVRVSVMFHFVHYTFSSLCILSICNIYLFPALVLRAGFAFWLHQFLFIAFLLLSVAFWP